MTEGDRYPSALPFISDLGFEALSLPAVQHLDPWRKIQLRNTGACAEQVVMSGHQEKIIINGVAQLLTSRWVVTDVDLGNIYWRTLVLSDTGQPKPIESQVAESQKQLVLLNGKWMSKCKTQVVSGLSNSIVHNRTFVFGCKKRFQNPTFCTACWSVYVDAKLETRV